MMAFNGLGRHLGNLSWISEADDAFHQRRESDRRQRRGRHGRP